MTFKTIFYCDKCGQESTWYAEWMIKYGIDRELSLTDKSVKKDLCKVCHDTVYNIIQSKEQFMSAINLGIWTSTASDPNNIIHIKYPSSDTSELDKLAEQRDKNNVATFKALKESTRPKKKPRPKKK